MIEHAVLSETFGRAPAIPLPDGEVHLWCLFPGEADDPRLMEAAPGLLDAEELARLKRIRVPGARRLFLAGRLLVRTALSRYADRPPTDWRFVRSRDGKPEIDPLTGPSDLSFNLAHTAGAVLLAVARGCEVGVDVERRDRVVRARELIRRYFSPEERTVLERLPGGRLGERFFLYWTLKEAAVKALGRGLALPPGSFGFRLAGRRPYRIGFSGFPGEEGEGTGTWRFALISPWRPYVAALAVASYPERDVTLRCCRMEPSGEAAPLAVIPVGLSPGVTCIKF
ncbi:MAG: 4'-phosphopantetheinyl transferase family protein [Syntrophales bacterium]